MVVSAASVVAYALEGLLSSTGPGRFVVLSVASVLGTLLVGVALLVLAPGYVRSLERHVYGSSARSVAIGLGALVVGLLVIVLSASLLGFAVELAGGGIPESLRLLPIFAGSLLVTIVLTLGTIVAGSYLLRRASGRETEPSLWWALVVGTIALNVVYLLPFLNVLVVVAVSSLTIGAMCDRWWRRRRS